MRKVFITGGFEEGKDGAPPVRRTRIPVAEFAAAIKISGGEDIDTDEVECLLANMIYKVCISLFLFFFFLFSLSAPPRPPFTSTMICSEMSDDVRCVGRDDSCPIFSSGCARHTGC